MRMQVDCRLTQGLGCWWLRLIRPRSSSACYSLILVLPVLGGVVGLAGCASGVLGVGGPTCLLMVIWWAGDVRVDWLSPSLLCHLGVRHQWRCGFIHAACLCDGPLWASTSVRPCSLGADVRLLGLHRLHVASWAAMPSWLGCSHLICWVAIFSCGIWA